MSSRLILSVLLVLGLTAAFAPVAAQEPDVNVLAGCVEGYDSAADYFPQKATIEYAENFSVEYFANYKLVTLNETWPGSEPARYVLVQCGTPAPDGVDADAVIEVPATSLLTMATTYLPLVVELGLLDHLVGHDEFDYVTTPDVRALIDAGELVEVGEGAGVSVETVLDLEPSLILASSSGLIEYDAHPVLVEAGLPVVLTGDWLEKTPLGRAEWVKFVGLFYNREAEAEAIFNEIADEYQALVSLAAGATERPTVFVDAPWQGTWYMAGGGSYTARLLADAGADYLWADDESGGSQALSFEAVLEGAADADFWVNAGGYWMSKADMLATDERFGEFAAVQNDNAWSNNLYLNDFGGNYYYEGGIAHPDWILADLVAIFHPALLPDHEMMFYRQLK
ncbi:MAG: ABC transporter substrate-binding protein [Anaerolineae bacterium]|nr:ABC transporter substrate-binding protein [Anaerolineae bacterium]